MILSRNSSFDSKACSVSARNSPRLLSDSKWSTPDASPSIRGSSSSFSFHTRPVPKLELAKRNMVEITNEQLLEFRKFLPQDETLQSPLVASTILHYAQIHKYGVVTKSQESKNAVEELVLKYYGIHLSASSTINTVQGGKHWFLPGWFLMPGAHGTVLRMITSTNEQHYVLVTAFASNQQSPNKFEARVLDSGRSITVTSRDELERYLHINGYTDICPMSIAYPKNHRSNHILTACLDICQVFYDIFMIQFPNKASEQRNFIAARNRYLNEYFAKVESCPPDQLRFKSKFLLSQPLDFTEVDKYTITMVQGQEDAKSEVSDDEGPLDHLKEFVDALPIYKYQRKKKKYPVIGRLPIQ